MRAPKHQYYTYVMYTQRSLGVRGDGYVLHILRALNIHMHNNTV